MKKKSIQNFDQETLDVAIDTIGIRITIQFQLCNLYAIEQRKRKSKSSSTSNENLTSVHNDHYNVLFVHVKVVYHFL